MTGSGEELLKYHVNQCDETRVEVLRDGRPAGTDSRMWLHRSEEFYKDRPVILYEYQKTRHHQHPLEFYKDFKGILVTDGLQQYHMPEHRINGFTGANCWAHARRDFADAVKAIGKSNEKALKQSTVYHALARIDDGLKELSPEERLRERQKSIKPLVEEYLVWVKERLSDTSALPKGKTAQGLNYSVNPEKYLKVFLEDGDIPIDNSASERAIRPFPLFVCLWFYELFDFLCFQMRIPFFAFISRISCYTRIAESQVFRQLPYKGDQRPDIISVLKYLRPYNVFAVHTDLHVISGLELGISHMVIFHVHKCGIRIGLTIVIPSLKRCRMPVIGCLAFQKAPESS